MATVNVYPVRKQYSSVHAALRHRDKMTKIVRYSIELITQTWIIIIAKILLIYPNQQKIIVFFLKFEI